MLQGCRGNVRKERRAESTKEMYNSGVQQNKGNIEVQEEKES
jgi:hypothetical protein